MKNLIHLPAAFEIKKCLTKEKFLNGADLNGEEKDMLRRMVTAINLVYDVSFPDKSEIILIDVTIKTRYSFNTDKEIARIIAQSIPHHCIVFVHTDDFGMIAVYLTRQNAKNSRRHVIEKQSSSPIFNLQTIPFSICTLMHSIENELTGTLYSAVDAMKNCVIHLEVCKEKYDKTDSVEQQITIENIRAQLEYGADHPNSVPTEKLYTEEDAERENGIVVKLSEEALCNSAYAFYADASGVLSECDWLLLYAQCCNKVLEERYGTSASDVFYQKLGAVFANKEHFMADDVCVAEIREVLSEEYKNNVWLAEEHGI